MRLREDISEILARQGGMILTRQVTECGLSLTMLSRYAKAGLLLREKSGVYTTPDGFVDPMLLMNLRVKQGVLSHGTALYLNGLTDRTPLELDVTIPKTVGVTTSLRKEARWFYVPDDVVHMGTVVKRTPFGNEVRTYDVERTICDIIRNRRRIGDDLALDGVRQYAALKTKNLARLGEYSSRLGITEEVMRTLEVVL